MTHVHVSIHQQFNIVYICFDLKSYNVIARKQKCQDVVILTSFMETSDSGITVILQFVPNFKNVTSRGCVFESRIYAHKKHSATLTLRRRSSYVDRCSKKYKHTVENMFISA